MAEKPVITCPKCEKKFKTKADVRGKKILCPYCDASFVVGEDGVGDVPAQATTPPASTGAEESDTIPIAGSEPAAPAPAAADDMEEGDDPYGVTAIDHAPRCPHCTYKMDPPEAVVCLNCGYNTLTREMGKIEKTIAVSAGSLFMHLLPGFIALFCVLYCIMDRIAYCIYFPYWVAGGNMAWMDHESLRMWSTMVALAIVFPLARIAYRRFIVKAKPEETVIE
jgi:DNA-directed RNA polymerase subunit RPC12/RpoP